MSIDLAELSPDDRRWIEFRLSSGNFATAGEYLVHLVHQERSRLEQEKLEDLLLEGLNSPSTVLTKAEWSAMREEALAQLAAERK